jgi:hypothetical protein
MTDPGSDPTAAARNTPEAPAGFWERHGARVGLALLFAYVVLLAVGTAGEVFGIRWILKLPIY